MAQDFFVLLNAYATSLDTIQINIGNKGGERLIFVVALIYHQILHTHHSLSNYSSSLNSILNKRRGKKLSKLKKWCRHVIQVKWYIEKNPSVYTFYHKKVRIVLCHVCPILVQLAPKNKSPTTYPSCRRLNFLLQSY